MAYARWLRAQPNIEVVPVWCHEGRVHPMDRRLFELSLKQPREQTEPPNDGTWAKLLAELARPEDDGPVRRPGPRRSTAFTAFRWYAEALGRTLFAWPKLRIPPADFYVNVNHYGLGQAGLLARLRKRGVKPVVMVHDLIPVATPEYCGPLGSVRHEERMVAVLKHEALIIANSNATAAEILAFAKARDLPAPELCVAPLGLESAFLQPRLASLSTRPYFICVGTIEPRKNLTFLLTLWRRLSEEMGEATPRLILVGRRGWECESVIDHLDRSPPVRRFVHEVCDLRDEQLAELMAGARALLAPSFIEGFDLPSVEALALGTPVIASDIPVHRELLTDAQLIDPVDGLGWLAAIETAATLTPVRRTYAPPTWPQHFNIVARALGLNGVEEATGGAAA